MASRSRQRAARGCGIMAELGSQLSAQPPVYGVWLCRTTAGRHRAVARSGQVIERTYNGKTARFKARIPPHLRDEFAPFVGARPPTAVSSEEILQLKPQASEKRQHETEGISTVSERPRERLREKGPTHSVPPNCWPSCCVLD